MTVSNDRYIITIDGPAGAGKSTIARNLAKKLNFTYVDTGAMYRAAALKVINTNTELKNKKAIEKLIKNTDIILNHDKNNIRVYMDGKDITPLIRNGKVSEATSKISAIPGVRKKLVSVQRAIAKKFKKTVFEGRDMGSAVFPDADLKIYLDADVSERAKRRFNQIENGNSRLTLKKIKAEIVKRDKRDKSRTVSPLEIPENACIIDSSFLTVEQVTGKIIDLLA
ncbi:MAG: (d)CMP kinase [Elusimicrobiota bacterium]